MGDGGMTFTPTQARAHKRKQKKKAKRMQKIRPAVDALQALKDELAATNHLLERIAAALEQPTR